MAGYLVALLPLAVVPRALFLYHYSTPLVFAVCAVALGLDRAGLLEGEGTRHKHWIAGGLLASLLLGFLVASPFSFAFVDAAAYRESVFRLLLGWR